MHDTINKKKHNIMHLLPMLLFVSLLFVLPHALHAGDEKQKELRSLLSEKSSYIVRVNVLMKSEVQGKPSLSKEHTKAGKGVLVDPSGIILAPCHPFLDTWERLRIEGKQQEVKISRSVKNIDIIFGSDTEEHSAYLAAKEKRFDWAFIKLENPDNLDFSALDLEQSSTPEVGQKAIGVNRLSERYNYASTFKMGRVNGKVNTPREMWAVTDISYFGAPGVSLPVYSTEGKLFGFIGRAGGKSKFLLPVDHFQQLLKRVKEHIQNNKKKRESAQEETKGDRQQTKD